MIAHPTSNTMKHWLKNRDYREECREILKGNKFAYLMRTPLDYEEFLAFLIGYILIPDYNDKEMIVLKNIMMFPYGLIIATSYHDHAYHNLFKYSLVPITKNKSAILLTDLWRDPNLKRFIKIDRNDYVGNYWFKRNNLVYRRCPVCEQALNIYDYAKANNIGRRPNETRIYEKEIWEDQIWNSSKVAILCCKCYFSKFDESIMKIIEKNLTK